jgi:predicted nucleotidyltransferase
VTKSDFHLIAKTLRDAEVPFLVVGGIAVVEHGYGRNTFDVDVVIRLERDVIDKAFRALELIGYRPSVPITAAQFAASDTRRTLLQEKNMQVLNFWSDEHRETPLDVFVTEPFDFASEYERAVEREVAPGLTVRIVSLETLFAMKREAKRPKDLADIDELCLLHGLPSSYDRTA